MESPRAAPLQIPSEDDVPLFDPSGLSASLSTDDWHNSFDLSSVAAARLGIGSPPSQNGSGSFSGAASIADLTHSDSRNRTNSGTAATSNLHNQASTSRSTSQDVDYDAQKLVTPGTMQREEGVAEARQLSTMVNHPQQPMSIPLPSHRKTPL